MGRSGIDDRIARALVSLLGFPQPIALANGVVGPQIPGGIPLLGPAPGVHPVLVEAQSLCAMALASLCGAYPLTLPVRGWWWDEMPLSSQRGLGCA